MSGASAVTRDQAAAHLPASGQTLTEYALILMLIALVVLVMLRAFGAEFSAIFSEVIEAVTGAGA